MGAAFSSESESKSKSKNWDEMERKIRYTVSDDNGKLATDGDGNVVWRSIMFRGRSRAVLSSRLAELTGQRDAILCFQIGTVSNWRLIPLLVDLPTSCEEMKFVVVPANSSGLGKISMATGDGGDEKPSTIIPLHGNDAKSSKVGVSKITVALEDMRIIDEEEETRTQERTRENLAKFIIKYKYKYKGTAAATEEETRTEERRRENLAKFIKYKYKRTAAAEEARLRLIRMMTTEGAVEPPNVPVSRPLRAVTLPALYKQPKPKRESGASERRPLGKRGRPVVFVEHEEEDPFGINRFLAIEEKSRAESSSYFSF